MRYPLYLNEPSISLLRELGFLFLTWSNCASLKMHESASMQHLGCWNSLEKLVEMVLNTFHGDKKK